jgi:phage baseplate assembly protein W
MAAKYKGFTTTNYGSYNYAAPSQPTDLSGQSTVTNFSIVDIDLVKRDLLNHIFTRRGERVMMPTFGTIIPDLVFEPLDEVTISLVEEEVVTVIKYDPRVDMVNITTVADYTNNSIVVSTLLLYIEFNITLEFNLNIEFQ